MTPQAKMILDAVKAGKPIDDFRRETMRPFMNEAVAAARQEFKSLSAARHSTENELREMYGLEAWLTSDTSVIQRNDHSRSHRLCEAMISGKVLRLGEERRTANATTALHSAHVFVVRHDWAAALGPAIDATVGDVALPYESCLFEFLINKRCVIVWAIQPEGGTPKAVPFVELDERWYCAGADECRKGSPFHSAWQQVVAICVALDAEVAVHEVIRAPAALNKKRARRGKPPLRDFHVIDLSRRHRTEIVGNGSHASPRLHFRRGHWRHYDTHRSWIRWTLVGNPDLGFVDKQYSI